MLRALAVASLLLAAVPAIQAQGTQESCPDPPEPELFLEWESSLENLAFDGNGSLYLSDTGGDRIVRVAPDGSSSTILDRGGNGLVWGPDDRLYVIVDDPASAGYDVVRSTGPTLTDFEAYSRGLPTYNGMAFDAAGNLFVSDDNIVPPEMPPDLVRIPADNPLAWEPWTDLYGPDGLAFDAATDSLYTGITADQSSPVVRISTVDPTDVEVVTYLSFGVGTLEPTVHEPQGDPLYPAPKGLDDLVLGPDGLLYITAHLTGELMRVDPATGSACVLASGLEEPTSVRIARGFGEHGGKLAVTTWGGTGVTGLAMTNAGAPPPGKVWMFDVGFVEEPTTGEIQGPEPTTAGQPFFDDNNFEEPPATEEKKDTPSGPLALLALLAAVAFGARRR